jgi:PAS domain S-box-containing protein
MTDILQRNGLAQGQLDSLLLDQIQAAVMVTDPKGTVIQWNHHAEVLFGWSSEEAVGRTIVELIVGPQEAALAADVIDRLQRGERWEGEFPVVRKDGSKAQIIVSISPLFDETGRVVGMLGISFDITERRLQERRLTVQYAVSRVLSESDSLDTAAPRILDELSLALGWEVGAAWQIDDAGAKLRLVSMTQRATGSADDFERLSGEIDFLPGVGLPGRVWESGEPLWIPDVALETNFPRAKAAAAASLHGAFAFPILLGTEVLGVVEFFSHEIRMPDQDLLDLVTSIGRQLGQFAERTQAETMLRASEARKGAVLEAALDAVVAMDAEGRITDFSPSAEAVFGHRRDDVIGRLMADVIVPADMRDSHWDGLHRYLETREARILNRRLELRALRADGTEFPVELTVTRVDLPGPPLFTAFIRDITERQESEEALARLASIVESTDEAIIGKTLDGTIVSWNDSAERVYGYKSSEAIGQHISMLVPPGQHNTIQEILERVGSGGVDHRETMRMRKNGDVIQVEITVSPIRNRAGEVIGASTIARDISERKLAQERLRFLAEASRLLAGSLNYEGTLESLARLAVPNLTDWCIVYVLQADGSIRRLAMAAGDADMEEVAGRIQAFRMDPAAEQGVPQVIRSGESALVPDATPELLAADVDDSAGLVRLLRPLGVGSWMCVPLQARGRSLGAISFLSAGDSRRYDRDDLALAEELARLAAIAVDNSRLYEAERLARRAAEDAARQTALLHAVTAALSEALTPEQVAEVVVDRGVMALGARAGLVALLSGDRLSLEIFRAVGYPEETMERWRSFPVDGPYPLSDAVRTGDVVVLPTVEARRKRYPAMQAAHDAYDHALACVPLLVERRSIGGMVLSFGEPREFTDEDRGFLLALGRQCAQALERARLFEAEQRSRAEAEDAQERLTFLADASEVMTGSLDDQEILAELARLSVPRLADWCIVDVLEDDGTVTLLAAAHVQPEKTERVRELRRRYPPDWTGDHTIPRVLRTGLSEIAAVVGPPEIKGLEGGAGAEVLLAELGLSSHLVVPLIARGRTYGAISFVFGHSGRHYSAEDLSLAEDLARRAGLAMENARLYVAEQRERQAAEAAAGAERAARAEAETAREQLAFLAEASEALSSSLDYNKTLGKVARLAVPRLADWCSVDIVDEDGSFRQLAVAHVDPAKIRLARQFRKRYPPNPDDPTGLPAVVRTGRPELYPAIPQELIEAASPDDPKFRKIIRDLGLRSAMIVPLGTRGRTVGAITFVWAESPHNYGPEDLALAEDLARRAGQAVENARLYEERDHIAHTLQQSLLPPELPDILGVELAARYLPAGEGNEVGGDFYDVFDTGDGAWGVVIGDVCGTGPAAAAVMGLARYTLRAAAMQERKPSRILLTLNEAVRRQTTEGRFLTVAYARVRPRPGQVRLTVCCGGHPLPIILRADGSQEAAGRPGTLLGLFPDPNVFDRQVQLGPGDTLIMFTDGVTDLPADGPVEGERRLTEALAKCAGLDAEKVAELLEREVLRRKPGGTRDDMALLVTRVTP